MIRVNTFKFNDQVVEFEIEGEDVMVNATEMGKVFGKRPGDFLALTSTKQFISELKTSILAFRSEESSLLNAVNVDLKTKNTSKMVDSSLLKNIEAVKTIKGRGEDGGVTWMHSRLALKFASWLDVKFENWVYQVIHEITFGAAVRNNKELQEKARLMNRQQLLKTKLSSNPDFLEYLSNETRINQAGYRIGKNNSAQLSMFIDVYKD